MRYRRGEIVWVHFPFTDVSAIKLRPALIISNATVNKTSDYILMQITTRVRDDDFSFEILEAHYLGAPLLKRAELRLHKIFILNEGLITQKITTVSEAFMNNVIDKILVLLR